MQFKIHRCSGDISACDVLKKIGIIEIELYENKLKFSENYKKKLVSHPAIVFVNKEYLKLNDQDAKLSIIFITVDSEYVKLEIIGLFQNDTFLASNIYASENGRIALNGSLIPNE